jgi:hypothetical protein
MTENDIVGLGRVIETLLASKDDEAEEKAIGPVVALAINALIDLNRIANALEMIANNTKVEICRG